MKKRDCGVSLSITSKLNYVETIKSWDGAQKCAHEFIVNEIDERNAGWVWHVGHDFPDLFQYPNPLILGSFAWTDTISKQRWIRPQHVRRLGHVDRKTTSSQVARAYLKYKLGDDYRRIRTVQYKYFVNNRKSQPLYASPCHLKSAVYIDIKAAYWTIIRVLGLTVDYMPQKWLAYGVD